MSETFMMLKFVNSELSPVHIPLLLLAPYIFWAIVKWWLSVVCWLHLSHLFCQTDGANKWNRRLQLACCIVFYISLLEISVVTTEASLHFIVMIEEGLQI